MKGRCCNPNDAAYHHYGERGITVCDEWRHSFETFRDWALASGYRDDLSIDRIDNDKGYTPDNCRWATAKEQSNNTRRTRILTMRGISHSAEEWSRITGIARQTILYRIDKLGWSTERALSEEVA